jgi:hypothetical protein
MALPRVNEVLKFSLTIPSTGKIVKYRPYLVKEEKVLLQAFESQDLKACLQAMCDTIEACIDDEKDIEVSKLPTFDLEYMFIQIRGKSVGETSDIRITCKECGEKNEHSIDLNDITVKQEEVSSGIIDITDSIKVEVGYPNYEMIMNRGVGEDNSVDNALEILADTIKAVHTPDERIDVREQPRGEVVDFLNSMTASQLKILSGYIENMPKLKHDVKFNCKKCGVENEVTLEGLTDFF